jgi:hypothetical protein
MIGHNSHWTITQTGPRGTKIMGLSSYILVSSPRDSTRIVDFGLNLKSSYFRLVIFDLINLCLLLFLNFIEYFTFLNFHADFG